MSNNVARRRKWAFEKGRNSSSVFYALSVTVLICAAVICLFRYDYRTANDIRQSSGISLIGSERKDFMRILDQHDPSFSYRINNGGFPFCLTCRRSHHPQNCAGAGKEFEINQKIVHPVPIPAYPSVIPSVDFPEKNFPATANYAEILPAPAGHVRHNEPVLTDQHGKQIVLKQFAALAGAGTGKKTLVISLAGSDLLAVSRVISSSGDSRLDRQAANILKAAGLPAGTYTIYWPQTGGKK